MLIIRNILHVKNIQYVHRGSYGMSIEMFSVRYDILDKTNPNSKLLQLSFAKLHITRFIPFFYLCIDKSTFLLYYLQPCINSSVCKK